MKITIAHVRQAVQTASAGVLAMYFSRYLGLPEGYWAAITAVIVLQASLGAALKESWVRIAATAIGAAVAIPVVTYFGRSLPIFGAALFATVLVCSTLRLRAGLRVAATTVAIIMLIPRPGTPWEPGIHRFLEVSFGVVVALVVSKFVWPSPHSTISGRGSPACTHSFIHCAQRSCNATVVSLTPILKRCARR